MYSINEALNLSIEDVYSLYREYSNQQLPSIYKKFSFGHELISEADGSWLFTSDGKKKYDLTGGLGVANFGHNNPRILDARKKYVDSKRPEIHKSYFNPILAAASYNLSEILKSNLKYSFFCNSGAEAVDGALKITYKRYSGNRKIVLHSNRSFHGKTIGAGSISAGDNFVGGKGRFYFQKIPGVISYDFNNLENLVSIIDSCGGDNVYAIFVEPFSCSTLTESSMHFLNGARSICNKHGISLVFDEIYSGFGKCGYDFYFHKYGVEPDVICLSKALGGGKASISSYVASAKIFEDAYGSIAGALTHSTTYNSFGEECATALEACNILVQENVSNNALALEKLFNEIFVEWVKDANNPVISFKGAGSHFGLILKNPISLLQPIASNLPIDFTSDPLFTDKLYTTSLTSALWEDADCLCAFTSNNEVILNISPSPISSYQDVHKVLKKVELVLKSSPLKIISRVLKNSMSKL